MSVVISGGAGFIGSRLAKHFVGNGVRTLVIDNLCRGREEYLNLAANPDLLSFKKFDAADEEAVARALSEFQADEKIDAVWHMAANSDIPAGIADAHIDLKDTFLTTFAILRAMEKLDIPALAFASSSAIYGQGEEGVPFDECYGPLLPISNYGAMKLASEAAISAAAESWLSRAWIFRFPNVVGTPATHGVILDFVRKLAANPAKLPVLGNGSQQKAYLHVQDLVEAMLFIVAHAKERLNIYNIGPSDEGCTVREIAECARDAASPDAAIEYGREDRGWVGDVPRFKYDVNKLISLGWQPRATSKEAVARAVREIIIQERQ